MSHPILGKTSVLLVSLLAALATTPAPAQAMGNNTTATGAQSSPAEIAPGTPQPATSSQAASGASSASRPPVASTAAPGAKPSPAATPAAETTAQEMPPILVTAATRDTQPVDTTATTTTVLSNDFLSAENYVLLPDALASVPGLSVVTSGNPGAQTSVFIHGLDSRQTLVTVDGRRQAVGFSGADDNLANLTLDNIDQVEVVRTPISSEQGGSAMGGVINLVTLSGKGITTPESSVFFEGGSFDTFREGAQSRGQIGGFDYAVAGSRQDSSYSALSPGYAPFFSPGFAGEADPYRNSSFRGNFGYQITPDLYVDVHGAYNNSYTGSPGMFLFPDPTASLTIEDWNISPEVVWKVADFYTTKLYYIRDQQRLANNDPFEAAELVSFGDSPAGFVDREQLNTDSVDWQNDFQIARNWSLTAGIQGDNKTFYVNDNLLGRRVLDGNENNLGGFISSQWQPIDGLNVLTSGRYDGYSAFNGAFSGRQAVSYRIAPTKTLVHASVAQAYTPPTVQDLFFSSPSGPILANPNLRPETDFGWEAGVEQPFLDNRVTPSVTYFHNKVHDDIEDVPIPSAGPFAEIPENETSVTTDGVEIGLLVQPISTVSLNTTYTYTNATNDQTQLRLLRRPRQYLTFTGTWKPLPPLTLAIGGTWVMDRQDLDALTGAQEDAPDYFVLHASATYRINDMFSVWIRGENLTDEHYQPALGYLAPGAAAYGGIRVSF